MVTYPTALHPIHPTLEPAHAVPVGTHVRVIDVSAPNATGTVVRHRGVKETAIRLDVGPTLMVPGTTYLVRA